MTFICHASGTVSEPREKPVMVVLSERPKTYASLSSDGEPKTTHGHEIEREVMVRSHIIKGQPSKPPVVVDPAFYVSAAKGRHEHARRCKKLLDDCPSCLSNVAWFATLPLAALSRVTEEVRFR